MLSPTLLLPLAAAGSVLMAILGIGFLIFVHELGHYLACRLTKTRVETFSIGFGTRLFGWESRPGQRRTFTLGRRRLAPADHAMDFRVSLVPLGGYVKMAGENPSEERSGAADEFPSKSLSARVFIVSAGVLMNVIAAWALYLVAFGAEIEQEPALVGAARPGGPAWRAGLRAGDRLLTLDGARTQSFYELRTETVFLEPDRAVPAVLTRDAEQLAVDVTPRHTGTVVELGVEPAKILVVEQGDRRLEVGPTERVSVNGIPATGGVEAAALLDAALAAGDPPSARLVTAEGEPWELSYRPALATDEAPVLKLGIERYGRPVVDAVRPPLDGVLAPGDRIVAALSGERRMEMGSAAQVQRLPFRAPVDHLEIERGETTLRVPVSGATPAALHAWLSNVALEVPLGLAVQPLEVGTVTPGPDGRQYRYPSVPSVAAGLRAGDRLLAIDGQEVGDWADVIELVSGLRSAEPVTMRVRGPDPEAGERVLRVTPVALEAIEGPTIAVAPYVEPYETAGIVDAAGSAARHTVREIRNIFRLIGAFVTGRLSFESNVGGPATIVVVSSRFARTDWLKFLLFLGYISVTLAVLNILPIPILDGGHLLFMLIEKLKGSPLKEETMGKLQFAGLMLLLVLMFFAFKNDVLLLTR